RVIGAVSIMSSAFPAGGPSKISVNTTSASSMSAILCAVVDPTNPPPTTVTFFRAISSLFPFLCELCPSVAKSLFLPPDRHPLDVLNNRPCKRRSPKLDCTWQQSFQVVRHFFLLNRAGNAVFNELRGFCPAQKLKHHRSAQHHRTRIDNVLVRIFRR